MRNPASVYVKRRLHAVLNMARFILGVLMGAAFATAVALLAQEPAVSLTNGILEGWTVVRDDETLICQDPTVFVRARQIQCP